jgi:carbonic anhydrase
MSIAEEARREVDATHAAEAVDTRAAACEQAAVRISLRNLMTFPFVQEAVAAGRLRLHGWYFDLDGGELLGYDPTTGRFEVFVKAVAEQSAIQHTTLP